MSTAILPLQEWGVTELGAPELAEVEGGVALLGAIVILIATAVVSAVAGAALGFAVNTPDAPKCESISLAVQADNTRVATP